MFQIKFSNGYEILVIGRSENGLCKVYDRHGKENHVGTYATCTEWLTARGCKEVAGNTGYSMAIQAGRI